MKEFKYKMSYATAKELLRQKKGEDRSLSNQAYLCKTVNETYGLLGTCIEVIYF